MFLIVKGITNICDIKNDRFYLFGDIDTEKKYFVDSDLLRLKEFLRKLSLENDLDILLIKTFNGYHIIGFNPLEYSFMINLMKKLLPYGLDKKYYDYTIDRGFATLRISKKTELDNFILEYCNFVGKREFSYLLYDLYSNLVNKKFYEESNIIYKKYYDLYFVIYYYSLDYEKENR